MVVGDVKHDVRPRLVAHLSRGKAKELATSDQRSSSRLQGGAHK
jgi:hypothetical protein